ncbi:MULTISPECIES: hypothetical protein [Gordonia]|uniref:Uncharacterized protein n=1 Tax=Gordonia amicalis TaxID=89053 RepID=A0AAE4UAS3_9ACTN|nr:MULTISPECIES: hypothetical protein [Gordonia]ATD71067.1 hypothetical protein CNO18_13125 [Gordonia sp. 1D]MDV6312392.1 hypothetical protein [Gordonia amicalis]MDV7077353.1 hypothetical protein [Gordonia amicalis]UKO90263.1 hypothetical protein IHQ52_14470 [Gordonia amicalis]
MGPDLRRIRFEQAAQAPPGARIIGPEDNPRRYRSRLAARQARRRAERARNSQEREALRDAERRDHLGSRPPF